MNITSIFLASFSPIQKDQCSVLSYSLFSVITLANTILYSPKSFKKLSSYVPSFLLRNNICTICKPRVFMLASATIWIAFKRNSFPKLYTPYLPKVSNLEMRQSTCWSKKDKSSYISFGKLSCFHSAYLPTHPASRPFLRYTTSNSSSSSSASLAEFVIIHQSNHDSIGVNSSRNLYKCQCSMN